MCSEGCDVTGEIVAAGAGYYSRIKFVKGKGAVLGAGGIATLEEFAAAKDRIFDLVGAAPYARTIDDETRKALGMEG